jgi:hypothetical protein
VIKLTRNITRKTTKQIFAMVAAIPATAKNPRSPAIKAMIRKIKALDNIATSTFGGAIASPKTPTNRVDSDGTPG